MAGVNETGTITLKILAQDLASGNIGKFIGNLDRMAKKGGLMGSVMQGVGQSFGQMLNPVAMVSQGIGAVADVMGDSIAAFREEQVSISKMTAALEANVEGWDGNTRAIEDVLAARMELGFSDDEQRQSLSELVVKVQDVSAALDIQRTAMDFARLRSISLGEASTILGKAYLGNVTALGKYGIKLEKGVSGTKALAEVQKRAAGQAEAYTQTAIGRQELLAVKYGELQEKIGALLQGPADGFISFLSGIVDVLDGPSGATQQILDLAGSVSKLKDAAKDERTALQLSQEQYQKTRDAIGLLELNYSRMAGEMVNAVGADTLAMLTKYKGVGVDTFYALASRVNEAGGDLSDFQAILEGLARESVPGANLLTDAWTGAFEEVGKKAENVPGIFWNMTQGIVGKVKAGIPDVRSVMKDLRWAIEHPMKLAATRAEIEGALTSRRLARGIRSNNPLVRQAAIDARSALLTQWNSLPSKAMELGRLTIAELVRGLNEGEQYALGLYGETGTTSGDRKIRNRTKPRRRRAMGGYAEAGATYDVGEESQERLTMLPGGGAIVTPVAGGGRSGTTVIINFNSVTPPSEAEGQRLARTLVPHLRREMGRAGI